jgi:pimeloyl-ACP methyl ester carboxylesterase
LKLNKDKTLKPWCLFFYLLEILNGGMLFSMSPKKTLLIHGYGVLATYPFIRPKQSPHLGFRVFQDQLNQGQSLLFRWGMERKYSFWEMLNPLEYLALYQEEKQLSHHTQTFKNLALALKTHQPETVICHSMGGLLFQQFSLTYSLPSSVKQIILVQGDVSRSLEIPKSWEHLVVKNVWCFWDQALWESVFVNRYLPAGLFGVKAKTVQNIFMPLYRTLNLHESPLHDPELLRVAKL